MFDAVFLFKDALYGALVIALACSVLGVYVVLRRIVFVGAMPSSPRRASRWRSGSRGSGSRPA